MALGKPKVVTDEKKIDELLSRAVDTVYPTKEALKKALMSGKRLKLYTGVDPTSPDLHIGHTLWMWKLKEFQDLGHEVILLMGSFTAMIGDPTGKASTRKTLTKKEVISNTKLYKQAAGKILNFSGKNPVKVMWNHKWLEKMKLGDLLPLMSHFTVQQMMERDMFEKRLEEGQPIGLHEFMYPLMQGYDSVAMDVDLEIGATDQTFNMLAGRTLQRAINQKEKLVLTTPLLTDANGKKIGKSEGNVIAMLGKPEELFGQIMALGDSAIIPVAEYATRLPMEQISQWKKELEQGTNPRDIKMQVAQEIVRLYHNEKAAEEAKQYFVRVFQKHEAPQEIPAYRAVSAKMALTELLVDAKLAPSKSEARRLIEQGGVKVNEEVITDPNAIVSCAEGTVVQKGKRQFIKITR